MCWGGGGGGVCVVESRACAAQRVERAHQLQAHNHTLAHNRSVPGCERRACRRRITQRCALRRWGQWESQNNPRAHTHTHNTRAAHAAITATCGSPCHAATCGRAAQVWGRRSPSGGHSTTLRSPLDCACSHTGRANSARRAACLADAQSCAPCTATDRSHDRGQLKRRLRATTGNGLS